MEWYYIQDGEEIGPVEEEDFELLLSVGKLSANTRVRNKMMEEAVPFRETRKGRELLGGPAVPAAPGEEAAPVRPSQLHYKAVAAAEFGFYASFRRRAVARLLDFLVLAAVFVIGALNAGAQDDFGFSLEPGKPGFMFTAIGYVTLSAMTWLYFTVFIGRFAATPGMIVCNMRVVLENGDRITYLRAFLRFGIDWLLLSLFIAPGLCSYALVIITPNKTAIHDVLCGTRVLQLTRE